MHHLRYTPRRALRVALALGAAGAASLALAGVAGAAVIPITPDGSAGTDNLGAAITTANTNSSTSNTIVLAPGTYTPGAGTTATYTITKNLTIVGDHSFQCNGGVPGGTPCIDINGSAGFTAHGSNNVFTINSGVTVNIQGVEIDSTGGTGTSFSAFTNNGILNMNGVEMDGSPGYAVVTPAGGVTTLTNFGVNSDQADALQVSGRLTLNNVTISSDAGDAIDTGPAGYVLNVTNTLLQNNGSPLECSPAAGAGGGVTNGGPASIADDSTCGVASQNQTGIDSLGNLSETFGGPNDSTNPGANNAFTTNKGINCPTTDERFYVNPVVSGTRECDIGAVTAGATQETTAPSCVVTSTNEGGTPPTQQVSLSDAGSGIGTEAGAGTDNPTNTVATAYPPPAPVPVPGYAVSNLQISNGSVAFTPFTSPSTSPLVLTASKTTVGTTTQWSFTGLNWAGVSKNCF
jgi:hypothetical protein